MQKLATVEATQSLVVLFALMGELIYLSIQVPSLLSWIGMFIVSLGMILHSYSTHDKKIIPRMMPKKTDHV
ncbi:UNVERIFIED_CONTAM: hypothetical protein ABIC26_000828 [Paenibacillus sp. PvR008]